jgi:hypothetical protein
MAGRKGKFYISGIVIRCYWLPWFSEELPVFAPAWEGPSVSEVGDRYWDWVLLRAVGSFATDVALSGWLEPDADY